MADAERDRDELAARIEQLESDNKQLQAANATMIEENRQLVDQLEALNTAVTDSEAQVKSLEATLLSSQRTIRRLEAETACAEALERQITSLEEEQAELQSTLLLSREEARSAVSRWRRAERGISDLQEQLERIEREANEERQHHIEMMARIERQREVEKGLNIAAGRLKGAAAASTTASESASHGNRGSYVVGHFVRDLLQDNANLQYGIAELREMLVNANDEIQILRDQLDYHRPLGLPAGDDTPKTLGAELELRQSPLREQRSPARLSQELHIHHHYHVPTRHQVRKPRKKRLDLAPRGFGPPASSYPSTPPGASTRHSSALHSKKNSILSNRLSLFSAQQSEYTLSSAPSSPRSNNRNSMFDPPPLGSFPGSPTSSIDPLSPGWQSMHRKTPSNTSTRSFQAPMCFPFGPAPPSIAHPIVEESSDGAEIPARFLAMTDPSIADDDASSRGLTAIHDDDDDDGDEDEDEDCLAHTEPSDSEGLPAGRRLRRVLSHESILSLSGGLDIHTLKSRPSQRTIRQLGSASSVTGSSNVTARPLISRDSAKRSSVLLRDSFRLSPVGSLQSYRSNASSPPPQQQPETSKLGKLVGWRPWGASDSKATISTNCDRRSVSGPAVKEKEKDAAKGLSRSPGINQPGAVPGFSEFLVAATKKKAPAIKTTPDVIDHEALKESLDQ
ncbi:hypothetical protein F4777DRAFT_543348 [Nemania sp. FL0916]|nr:hypothetical protein F4777DRAFT_543348 [Nemania sp. FL0916]